MSEFDFSIIIPTYNRAQQISKAILSIINQSVDNWNLIIIDDGSTDNTKGEIQKFLVNDKIKYVYQQHSGVSMARNHGIKLASSDHIIFLDSDDKFYPDLIRDLTFLDHKKYDLIFWEVKKKSGETTSIWKPRKLEKIYNGIRGSFLSGSVCYRKVILESVGGFDPNIIFGENFEMGMRIAHLPDLKTITLPSIYLEYNINLGCRPNSEPSSKLKSLQYLLQKHAKIYSEDSLSHSRLLYQIGYLNERLKRREEAYEFFKLAFKKRPFYFKPFLKILHYQLKKLGLKNISC
ncbi:glycosyltransferase family 2 protein [Christiangramia sabulilitoris]|uniref:Glycosyltransferase family 2 protein n=1 Tax=Christiangramia sabulilitoris TaxID=2583991 RepID=A0A550I299_9FLAO|nr:glycosyltransferase family A protein [Christiangramia sabulilitoris]TRO65103.1 glycosyltransferase family 2 protein [Christiangramia sabulilitoris]